MRQNSRKFIVITDPGPDPDDVKALLALVVAHKRGNVQLVACIANGGGFPARRAQLARLILDRMGEPNIPVGIGSAGTVVCEQLHECNLHGFDSVNVKRLIDGPTLLARTLARSPAGSVTMLLISGLRDFADVISTSPELVLRAVGFVAVQGGLVADSSARYGYCGDTSQNNAFHPASAEIVYDFCFEHRIRMSVVSRNAVPLLPMQLARSFAVRTQSELLTYLAKAQALGLEGLWQKLCAGQLPERCNKSWYFQTFCGVSPEQFEKRKLGLLTASASVLPYLNGYVKPYDVLALMTALPTTTGWFSPDAEVVVNGASHLLLLEPEHTIDVRSVHNFLRETYHAVAIVDSDPEKWRSWRRPGARRSGRRAPVVPAADAQLGDPLPLMVRNPSLARLSSTSHSLATATDAAGLSGAQQDGRAEAVRAQQPWPIHRARSRPKGDFARVTFAGEPAAPVKWWHTMLQMRRNRWDAPASSMSRAEIIHRLHAERLRAPDGTVGAALTTELLADSVAAARVQHSQLALVVAVLTAFICTGALAVKVSALPGFPKSEEDIPRLRASTGVSYFGRMFFAANGFGATGCMMLMCLFPSYEHLTRMMLVAAFGYGINLGASLPYIAELVALQTRGWDEGGQGPGGRDVVQLCSAIGSGAQATGSILVSAVSFSHFWAQRKDPRCVLDILWNSLVATWLLNAAINLAIWVGLFLGGIASPPQAAAGCGPCAREYAVSIVATALALAHALSYLMWAYAAQTHVIVRRMRMCLAVLSGASGLLESLAPLLGYGQLEGERDVVELHREAKAALCGAVMEAAGLAALGHAWGVDKEGSGAAKAHNATNAAEQGGEAQQAAADAAAVQLAEAGVQAVDAPDAPIFVPTVCRVDAVDAYIVHSWHDEHVDAKLEVLANWCRTFALSRGRPPVVWVDALCALPPTSSAKSAKRSGMPRSFWATKHATVSPSPGANSGRSATPSDPPQAAPSSAAVHADKSAAQLDAALQSVECQLEHLPVRLACSAQLLVLASPSLFDRLWPVIEIHTWSLTGGGQELIRVLPVAPTPREASALLAAVDTFHVVYCHARLPADRRRISMAIEIATMPAVNEAVRALFAPVRDALRRQAESHSSTTGDSKRVSTVSAAATEAADEMGDWYDEPDDAQ